MSRVDKINSVLLKELADLVAKNVIMENGLITLSYVECSPDLHYANIGVSVLPDNVSITAVKKLQRHNGEFSTYLRKKLKMKFIPRFNWKIDGREKYAAKIEELLKTID